MVFTSSNNLNRETKTAVSSLSPTKIKVNPIFGQIVNLLYQRDGTNLVSIIMQDNSSNILYTVSSDPNIDTEHDLIHVANLNGFQFRLQEAFNYQSLVNVYCKDNKIDSLVIVAKQIQELDPGVNSITRPSPGGKCCYGSPPCKK